jgi:hypothetical protein
MERTATQRGQTGLACLTIINRNNNKQAQQDCFFPPHRYCRREKEV